MFNLESLQQKRCELEKTIVNGKFDRIAEEYHGILACDCSGSCSGSCDDTCEGGCLGCGEKNG